VDIKMKKLITFIISILLVSISIAQSPINLKAVSIKYWDEELYGYKDENNNCIIEPIFKKAIDFTEGLGAVEFANGGYGYINATGKIVIENRNCQILNLYPFSNGYAKIQIYNNATEEWDFKYIDKFGKETELKGIYKVVEAENNASLFTYRINDYVGLKDKNGTQVVYPIYSKIEGIGKNFIKVEKSYRWGYIDSLGNEIIKPEYNHILQFFNGYAIAGKSKWGVIDMKGNIIIPFKYDYIRRGPNNLFIGDIGKLVELVDINNKRINNEDYKAIRYMEVDALFEIISNTTLKYGILDGKTGSILVEPKFDKILGKYNDEKYGKYYNNTHFIGYYGLSLNDIWIDEGGRRSLIGINGKELTEPIYSFIKTYSKDGIVSVRLPDAEQRYGFLDIRSGLPIKNSFTSNTGDLKNGTIIVSDSSKYGLIDKLGNYIIPKKYKEGDIGIMSDSLIALNQNGKLAYVNYKGKVVIPAQFQKAFNFKAGIALVQINNKWHYINKQGKIVSTTQYDDVVKDENSYSDWKFYAVFGNYKIEGKLQNGKFIEINKGTISNVEDAIVKNETKYEKQTQTISSGRKTSEKWIEATKEYISAVELVSLNIKAYKLDQSRDNKLGIRNALNRAKDKNNDILRILGYNDGSMSETEFSQYNAIAKRKESELNEFGNQLDNANISVLEAIAIGLARGAR
jgi:bifunctional DNA-binding transcriptional regulator/antitoxin component of YhaV-PrlF toxin-antitoxin module